PPCNRCRPLARPARTSAPSSSRWWVSTWPRQMPRQWTRSWRTSTRARRRCQMNLHDAKTLIEAGLALLPEPDSSREARAMLLAIALQESRFMHRRQIGGPARGYWQFEVGGVRGVMTHRHTSTLARELIARL